MVRSLMKHARTVVDFGRLVKEAFAGWWEDKAPRFGAAVAYYSVLSLAPILILFTPLADWLLGERKAQAELRDQFEHLIGGQGADVIEVMVRSASHRDHPGWMMQVLGGAVLLFAASAVFAQLQDALDTIWEVAPKPGRSLIWGFLRKRLLSFAMVLVIAFLLLTSLIVTTGLELLRQSLDRQFHGLLYVWMAANALVSFGVVTLLFAMIFKILPDATIAWRDVWLAAMITSGLFSLGKFAIGFYLGHRSFGTYYGAAGSIVVLLVWVYFSSQILFLGAEFAHAYAKLRGDRIVPEPGAAPLTKEAREQQGIPHEGSR